MMIYRFINKYFSLKINDIEEEYKKLGLSRIIIGIIITIRVFQLTYESVFYFETLTHFYFGIVFTILTVLFTIGLFTPVITLILILFWHLLDASMLCYTLGSSILILYFILFFISNNGDAKYSVDKILMTKNNKFGILIKYLYNVSGSLSVGKLKANYFLALVIYGLLSFCAILYHLSDSSWISGYTTMEILTNSYLSKYYNFFRLTSIKFPEIFLSFSKISMIGQAIFQLLMIPFLFNSYLLKFIKLWGLGFFLISLLFIQLSYLPHIELVIWFVIFYRKKNKVQIIYDDYCNLCKSSVKFLDFIDFNNAYKFYPLTKNSDLIFEKKINKNSLVKEIHGIYNEKLVTGYDLYIYLFWVNPLLIFLTPILYLGKLTRIGPLIYQYISKKRYEFFGTCELSFNINENPEKKIVLKNINAKIFTFYIHLILVICLLFFIFKTPYLTDYTKRLLTKIEEKTITGISSYMDSFFYKYTPFVIPNVFNKTDLIMGDYWAVLYRLKNNKKELVPITGLDGSRLNYNNFDWLLFGNHNCDMLYFGNTIQYRRRIHRKDVLKFNEKDAQGYNLLIKRIEYDYKKTRQKGEIMYIAEIYKLKKNKFEEQLKYCAKIIDSFYLNYNGNKKRQ